jgi:putative membrane protein
MKKLIMLFGLAACLWSFPAAAQLDTGSINFINQAALGGMMEVSAGKLAATKGQSAEVRAFANRMVIDHTKINGELAQLAAQKNQQLPEAPAMNPALDQTSGAAFDRVYVKLMIKDHEQDVTAFENAAATSSDTVTRAFARRTLPILKDHLARIRTIAARMHMDTVTTQSL